MADKHVTPGNADAIRADIRRMRKAVTRKISRSRKRFDVELTGTSFDPRRKPNIELGLSAPQLREYRHRLASFLDRSNQFVGDAQRRPIERQEWNRYKRLEREYNQKVNDYFERVANVELPSGETVAERMRKITPDHRQMGNPPVQAPFSPVERDPGNVASRAALEKLIKDMGNRLDPRFFEERLRAGMNEFEQMMDVIGDNSLREKVRGLSDEQFALLWNYEGFATYISINYEFALKDLSGEQRAYERDVPRIALRRAHELADYFKDLSVGG